jgi:hypothetical protein
MRRGSWPQRERQRQPLLTTLDLSMRNLVDGEIFQQRQDTDDDDNDAHDLLGAPVNWQHINQVEHKYDDKERNKNTD